MIAIPYFCLAAIGLVLLILGAITWFSVCKRRMLETFDSHVIRCVHALEGRKWYALVTIGGRLVDPSRSSARVQVTHVGSNEAMVVTRNAVGARYWYQRSMAFEYVKFHTRLPGEYRVQVKFDGVPSYRRSMESITDLVTKPSRDGNLEFGLSESFEPSLIVKAVAYMVLGLAFLLCGVLGALLLK